MVLSDSNTDGWRKFFLAGWGFMECLLFAGTFYGWSSMVFVLKDEGIYADLCADEQQADNWTSNNVANISLEYSVIDNGVNRPAYGISQTSNCNGSTINGMKVEKCHSLTNYTNGIPDTLLVLVNRSEVCASQESMFALCFTIASAIFCASCFSSGHINFKFGTRKTRLMSFPLFVTGTLCFAFVSKDLPWLIFPGLCLIGVGGVPLLITNTQISNLFVTGNSSVVGLLCGGYDMAAVILLIIKIAYENGIARQTMFLGLTVIHVMTLVSTFFFLPAGFINERNPAIQQAKMAVYQVDESLTSVKRRRRSIAEVQSLGSYMLQPLYITHNIWLCLLHLRYFYFLGKINTFLTRTLNGDKALVSYFTDVCFYTMMCGIVTSFFAGIVYDRVKGLFKSGKTTLYRDVLPAAVPQAIASILALLMSALILVPNPTTLYILFIVTTFYRSFLYSLAAAFISAVVPNRYFPVLFGLQYLIAAIFGCLQYAFFTWSEAYPLGELHGDICLLVLAVVSFCHPIYMTFVCVREERTAPPQPIPLLRHDKANEA